MLKDKEMTFSTDKDFATYIKELGGELFIVGGYVRDMLMERPAGDKDFVITGLTADKLPFEKIVGQDFPVFLVDVGGTKHEVALARTEKKNGKGYHGFTFFADKSITIEQDLARRDLRINAIALNVLSQELIDPFQGLRDIRDKFLCYTTDAFAEDPLRVYRVARFAAQLGFLVENRTTDKMHTLRDELCDLTAERVLKEFEKAMTSLNPRVFFDVLMQAGCLDVHFPEVAALDCPDKHDGTTYEHTMRLLEHGNNFKMRVALLCHDFGKALTPKEEWPAHNNHDELGEKPVKEFCKRLRIPTDIERFALTCTCEHMRVKRLDEMRPAKIIRMVLDVHNFDDVLEMSLIDSMYRDEADVVEEQGRFKAIYDLRRKAESIIRELNGDVLIAEGYEPDEMGGKNFGELLLQRRILKLKSEMKHCTTSNANKPLQGRERNS